MRWQQGYTLHTSQTDSWAREEWQRNEDREQKMVFYGMTPEDDGRSRVLVCVCEDALTARMIVREHNTIEEIMENRPSDYQLKDARWGPPGEGEIEAAEMFNQGG